MEKKQKSKEEEIRATLSSLDGMQRAEVSPFFMTRLQGRMQTRMEENKKTLPGFYLRPALVISTLLFFVLINIVTLYNFYETKVQREKNASIQSVASEYGFKVYTVYGNKNMN